MSDKHLALAAWKAFAKGQGGTYKDAFLIKAFQEFDKVSGGDKPEPRLKALAELDKQARVLLKATQGDKPVTAYIGEVVDQVEVENKAIALAQKAQAKANAKAPDDDGDGDDDAPELLTTKLAVLLKEVRRGVPMHAMLAIGSADSAVLLSRKPIGPPRRSLLTDYLGTSSGVKFPLGQCIWENNAFTFVLAASSQAPAKKIRAALKEQIGTLTKVRVRGLDPADVDEDDDDDDDDEAAAAKPAAAEPAKAVAEDPSAAVMTRLSALQARIKAWVAANGATAAQDAKLAISEAGALARQKRVDQAHGLIDALEKRMGSSPPPAGAPATGSVSATAGAKTAAAGPAAKTPATTLAPGGRGEAAARFKTHLTQLAPRIKEAMVTGDDRALRITAKNKEAVALAQKQSFEEAVSVLAEIEDLLKAPAMKVATQPSSKARPRSNGAGGRTMTTWQEARDLVGEQLTALDGALRMTGHPLLLRVADMGLNGLTKRLQVGMQVALMEYDSASEEGKPKAATRVKAAVVQYREFLASHTAVPLLESNPLGIPVSILSTLGDALDRIEAALVA